MKISAAKNIKLHLAIYLSARITAVVVPETNLEVRFYVGRSKSLVEMSRASLVQYPLWWVRFPRLASTWVKSHVQHIKYTVYKGC
jgi:hypothetical protein